MQTGFVGGFNGRMRHEILNGTMFRKPAHAWVVITDWAADDNTARAFCLGLPHTCRRRADPEHHKRPIRCAR